MRFVRALLGLLLGITLLAGVVAVGATVYVRHLSAQPPITLMSCMARGMPWTAWACEQVLHRFGLTPAQVADLNLQAGARLPLLMLEQPRQAERVLDLFLAHGVDIDAVDRHGLTALHTLACSGRSSQRVGMLLARGARIDIPDADSRLPLDLAMIAMWRQPNDNQASIIRMLSGDDEGLPASRVETVALLNSGAGR